MRIAHIIPGLAKGGAERLTLDIVNTLRKMGHEAEIFALSELNDYKIDYPDIRPIIAQSYYQPRLRHALNLPPDKSHLSETLKAWRPDVVHSHLWQSEVALCNFFDAPVFVAHVHDNMPPLIRSKVKSFLNKKKILG